MSQIIPIWISGSLRTSGASGSLGSAPRAAVPEIVSTPRASGTSGSRSSACGTANDERIQDRILLIRGQKVMMDTDLAGVYGVLPKRLREQVRRNLLRFPEGFMFQLSKLEMMEVSAKCGHLAHLKFSPTLPYVFTEHGAIMLAMVLNSQTAVETSVEIVKAFVHLREIVANIVILEHQ